MLFSVFWESQQTVVLPIYGGQLHKLQVIFHKILYSCVKLKCNEIVGLIQGLVAMKSQNPNLKAMVAIGGYDPEMVTPWYTLAASPAARQNFARNIREFIARNYLDGVGMYVRHINIF